MDHLDPSHTELFREEVTCGVHVLVAVGDLDIFTSTSLSKMIVGWSERGLTDLIIDLSRVDFTDSIGVGSMVKAVRICRARGGRLALAGAHGQVLRVLRLTGVDHLVELCASSEIAAAHLASP